MNARHVMNISGESCCSSCRRAIQCWKKSLPVIVADVGDAACLSSAAGALSRAGSGSGRRFSSESASEQVRAARKTGGSGKSLTRVRVAVEVYSS